MNKNTPESYREAVLAKYEEIKYGEFSGFLANPTPASLKNMCLLLAQSKMNPNDDDVFRVFFNLKKEGSAIESQITNFDTDKFRPLRTFLLKKTDLAKDNSVDLIAILVGFENRPYRKFIKKEEAPVSKKEETKAEEKPVEKVSYLTETTENPIIPEKQKISDPRLRKSLWVIGFILILSGLIYSFFPVKNCMEWKKDHYELVDCENQGQNFMQTRYIIPRNDERLNQMKKIIPTKMTPYFSENGDPLIWYSRRDNEYEFFTYPGLHPLNSNITLKKITETIINNYEESMEAPKN